MEKGLSLNFFGEEDRLSARSSKPILEPLLTQKRHFEKRPSQNLQIGLWDLLVSSLIFKWGS